MDPLREWNQLPAADGVLHESLTLEAPYGQVATTTKGPGFVVRGRLLAGQGKTPEALEALARATADAESINAESIRDLCEAFVMRIHLVIGLTTVKTHVNGIFRKLGASNRFEAVTRARAVGLLERVGHTAEEPNPE